MTSLRAMISRFIRGSKAESDLPDPGFNYRVYWTKQVMEWSPEQRMRIQKQVTALIQRPDFKASMSERIYNLTELDGEKYAGASMIELEAVLSALQTDHA